MSEATKTELPKEFSAVTKAVKKLKKLHAHQDERIKTLKRQNKELRKIDLWRVKEMDKQEFEIWRLKMFLKEAGYDPENLPQPKGQSFCWPAMDPFPISGAGPSCPQNEKTSLGPASVSPFKYSGPTLKRKRVEFDQDEEFNPDPKRRALPLTKFMEANKYACEETYGQYSVDHQLDQDSLDAKGRMDEDEDGESADEVEQVEKGKPETPASLSRKYSVENNLPASRQLGRAWDEPTPRRRAEDEQFERELEIAIKMSLEDLAQKKGKDGGEEEEEEAEETSSECEDEGEDDSAVEGEEAFGDEEGEEAFGDEEGEDFGDEEGEDFSDEEGKEDFGDEEGKEDFGDEEGEGFGDEEGEESFGDEGEEDNGDEGEEDNGDEGEEDNGDEEEGYGDEEEGYGDEEEGYGDEEEGYGDEEEGEDASEEGCDGDEAASPSDPFEYYSDDEGEVNGGRKLSREEVSALQLAIERSLRPASENGERVEKEAPALTPAQDLGAGENDKEAPVSVSSGHESRQNSPDIQHMAELLLELAGERTEEEGGEGKVPALNSTGHSSDEGEVEARGPLSKRGYSELELAIATSLESLRKGEDGRAEQSAPRAQKHVSKGSDQEEEAPVLEPFEYHSDNEGGFDLKVWSLEDTEDDSELYAPPSKFSRAN